VIYVDGRKEAAGLHAVPDDPSTTWILGKAVGHRVDSGGVCNGSMAPDLNGSVESIEYNGSPDVATVTAVPISDEVSQIPLASVSIGGLQGAAPVEAEYVVVPPKKAGACAIRSSNYPNHCWTIEGPERVFIRDGAPTHLQIVPGLHFGQGGAISFMRDGK
jgi:hypothetical protein